MKNVFFKFALPLSMITGISVRLYAKDAAVTTEKSPATIMFYLDNQNGDYVDAYIARQLTAIKTLSERNRKIRWLTMTEENGLSSPGNRSLDIKDQHLVVSEWINGEQAKIGEIRYGQENLTPSLSESGTLKFFLKKGLSLDSEHNILIMADHGVGSNGLMTSSLTDGASIHLNGIMTNHDAARAIEEASKEENSKIDLIIFDACLMSNIQALTDYRVAGLDIPIVASEDTTTPTSDSLDYIRTIGAVADAIEKNLSDDAILWGTMIVNLSKGNNAINVALINLKVLSNDILSQMKDLFARLASELKKDKQNKEYSDAYINGVVADKTTGVFGGVDLASYLKMLQKMKSFGVDIKGLAAKLESELFATTAKADRSKLVVIAENDQSAVTYQKGISIDHATKPDPTDQEQMNFFRSDCKHSESTVFTTLTGWSEVLKAYAGVKTCGGN